MDNKVLLANCITLLYLENRFSDTENSADLVRTALNTIQVSEIGIGLNTSREVVLGLKSTALDMCETHPSHKYDKLELLQRIRINTGEDDKFYNAIIGPIAEDLPAERAKKIIISYRLKISGYFREQQIVETISKASMELKFKREQIKDLNEYVATLATALESMHISTMAKDPAMIDSIDIGDDVSVSDLFRSMKTANQGEGIMRTGWQDFNDLTQGGLRRGEFVMVNALQHKYKTGFTLSLFKQIAIYNKPYMLDPAKKPLLLRISFEDELKDNLQFLYQNLKFNQTREKVVIDDSITVQDMASYIKDELQVNGYHIKMLRVDPTQWSYKSICNKVLEFEAEGYEVHVLMVDYLGLVPRTGCITGTMGSDLRDMYRRMRNFCSQRRICCITPHQLSTEAKQLTRIGIPEDRFVKEVCEKGYFVDCKQLDQEVDLELYVHKFKHQRDTYLAVQRGKHRLPTILEDDDKKYFLLQFPKQMPIPDDLDDLEHKPMRKLPSAVSNASDNLFKLG